MTFPRVLAAIALLLFGTIGVVAIFKGISRGNLEKNSGQIVRENNALPVPIEIDLEEEIKIVAPKQKESIPISQTSSDAIAPASAAKIDANTSTQLTSNASEKKIQLPEANRIQELFNITGAKLPVVETIVYKSRVAWQKGRPAWLSDYARYYQTSRHFIARSLNGKPDYLKQDVADGAKFNVLRSEKNIRFYLLADLSRCKIWFYCDDLDNKERILLKTYRTGVGRLDSSKASGFLTPLGQYSLGNKTAIYKPHVMGSYRGEQIEMIRIFGTRWIPFDKELQSCTAPAKGLGIHGLPWVVSASGKREEDRSSIGQYQSDGCIRLASEDIEEIFAIVITKPTVLEIVKDFHDSTLSIK